MGLLPIISCTIGLFIIAMVVISDIPLNTMKIHDITVIDVGRLFIVVFFFYC